MSLEDDGDKLSRHNKGGKPKMPNVPVTETPIYADKLLEGARDWASMRVSGDTQRTLGL